MVREALGMVVSSNLPARSIACQTRQGHNTSNMMLVVLKLLFSFNFHNPCRVMMQINCAGRCIKPPWPLCGRDGAVKLAILVPVMAPGHWQRMQAIVKWN